MTSIQGNVFDANGMSSISDIIRYISDIESASTDLDVMEHRLKNLDTKTGTVSNLKTSLTSAMDKAALTFNGEHTNVEGEQGGYRLITSSGYCKHSNGDYLSTCYKTKVPSASDCEDACESSNSCVGYDYGGSENVCGLFPSSQSYSECQSGYNYFQGSGYTMAKTADDLAASSNPGYQCYAKN